MITPRYACERGHAQHGWLSSRHSFSFGSYYDPKHLGLSALRVINDDRVDPGAGFPRHSHADMEIISYVKQGRIEHKDSMGHVQTLPAGEFQLMSAGTGVSHSEYNPSPSEPLNFLQIWIQPNQYGIAPGYQQKRFPPGPMRLIAAPEGEQGALLLHQDARLYQISLEAGQSTSLKHLSGRSLYLHIVRGALETEGSELVAGDGASLSDIDEFTTHSQSGVEALLFDLP